MLRIGTSGWIYRHWERSFYPPGLDSEGKLRFYARHFDTVEINNSFYRLPPREQFETWAARTPARFLFAVKASRYLTHMKRLNDAAEPLDRLLDRASGLGRRLGPILLQFPKRWEADVERLDAFLGLLGHHPEHRYAFEFRAQSWLVPGVYRRLERAGAALVVPVGMGLPLEVRLTAPWTYIRMHHGSHGIGYSDRELAKWAEHVDRFRAEGADVYVYFNNDTGGHALRDADRLRAVLAGGDKPQDHSQEKDRAAELVKARA
jgi:uncharacterized protein YecE (DUF72 family)